MDSETGECGERRLEHREARVEEEFLQFVEKQMSNGQACGSQFTYFAGPTRSTFRVDFDRNGKVINIAGKVGPP